MDVKTINKKVPIAVAVASTPSTMAVTDQLSRCRYQEKHETTRVIAQNGTSPTSVIQGSNLAFHATPITSVATKTARIADTARPNDVSTTARRDNESAWGFACFMSSNVLLPHNF